MKPARFLLPLLGIGLALILLVSCYLPAAPDVTPTPSQEEMMDVHMQTAAAQVAGTQMAVTAAASPLPTDTPTPPPPTAVEETPSPVLTTPIPLPTETPVVLPVETPSPTPVPPPTSETVISPGVAGRTHVVQPGEWLLQIARQYGVDWRELAAYNNILNPDRIYPGQVLRIPGAGEQPPTGNEILYTVQPGDNLFRIALRYNLNYLYLASYNNIANPHHIRVGQVIRIPVKP